MNSNTRLKSMILTALFGSIEVVLSLTPLGYIPIGPIRATTLHIPVILAGILSGRKNGAAVGFIFGFTSLIINTFQPTATSFVFSPFITIGEYSGNLASLWIVFGPRILLGFLSGVMTDILRKYCKKRNMTAMLTAAVNTVLHTVLVMGSIILFFGSSYAAVRNITFDELIPLVLSILATNGIVEAILATVIVSAVCRILKPVVKERK